MGDNMGFGDKIKDFSEHIKLKTEKMKQKQLIKQQENELTKIIKNIYEDPSIPTNDKINLIITATSTICGIIAAQPIPFADIFILTPIQTAMIIYISKIYNIQKTKISAMEIVVYLINTLGFGVLSQQAILGAYKTAIPYAGALTTIPLVYVATFILGKCAKVLIKAKIDGVTIKKEEINKIKEQERKNLMKDTNFNLKYLKKQLSILKNTNYSVFRDILLKFDDEIKINSFDITSIINKKLVLIERFSLYEKIQIKENVFKTLVFMNSNDIHSFEILIAKLNRKEFILNSNITVCKFTYFSAKIKRLNDFYIVEEINHKNKDIMDMIKNNSDKDEKILHNEQIRNQFIQSFSDAKSELYISSPWMNHKVVNSDLKSLIEQTLQRGVNIKIRYGIGNNEYDNRNITTNEVAAELLERFKSYKNFKMIKVNSHSKILVCDKSYCLLGSYNFLSFSGQYNYSDLREEESIYTTNKKILEILSKKFN